MYTTLDSYDKNLINKHEMSNLDIAKVYRSTNKINYYALDIDKCDLIYQRVAIPGFCYASMLKIINLLIEDGKKK